MKVYNGCDLGKSLYNNIDTLYITESLAKSIIKIKSMKKSEWEAAISSLTSNIPLKYQIIETPAQTIKTVPEICAIQAIEAITEIKVKLSRLLISGYVSEMENISTGAIIAANGHNLKEAIEIVFKRLRSYEIYNNNSLIILKRK